MFSESTYSVDENDGSIRPTIILSGPSSYDITIELYDTDGLATGECSSILINY